ncbi:MAG: glycosyltransferase family 1 protein [Gemmatimonadaceae bacterium]|jgi:glycosyltransferase involved in cell wall biosynthesis|nr:glycosyltransferase family 1 protein [Gemmatimonadaceae bacterium]
MTVRLALFTDTYAPQVNGVARTLARLVDAVRARGGDVAVFTADDPAATTDVECIRFGSVAFWAYPQLRLASPRAVQVDRALDRFAPTLIHAATPFGVGLAGRSAALRRRLPFVTSYHTSFAAYAAYYGLGSIALPGWHFLRWFHNSGARTFCPTRAIADDLAARGFARTAIWSRGVDVQQFAPTWRDEAWRASIGVAPHDRLVLYVGRLAAEKGIADVLAAAQQLQARAPSVRFAFVGDGPFAGEVARAAPPGTWLPGVLQGAALSRAYASADCFVFPSTTDTFGNVMLEAAASGLPIVAADVPQTRELIGGSGADVLVPAARPDLLASSIASLLADDARLRTARAAARHLAEGRAWSRVWDDLLGAFDTVIGGRAGDRAQAA